MDNEQTEEQSPLMAQAHKKWPALAFFKYKHLPPSLQSISKSFAILADATALKLLETEHPAEVAAGIRKLIEAKDCFVRAGLPANGEPIKK